MQVTVSLSTVRGFRGSAVDKIIGIVIQFEHVSEALDAGVAFSLR